MITPSEQEEIKNIGLNELSLIRDTKKYVKEKYNCDIYNNQVEIFDSIINPLNRNISIGAARSAGKSFSVSLSLIELCRNIPKTIVAVFAPKGPQSKRLLNEMYNIIGSATDEIKRCVNKEKSSTMVIEFTNGSKVQALSGHDKTMSEGEHPHVVVIDEAHLVSDFAWSSKIYPMLGAHQHKQIIKIGVFMYNNHYHKDFLKKDVIKLISPWWKCEVFFKDPKKIKYYDEKDNVQEISEFIFSCMAPSIKKRYFPNPKNMELWKELGQMTEQDFRMQMEMEWLDEVNRVLTDKQIEKLLSGTHKLEEVGLGAATYVFGLDPATGSLNPESLELDFTSLSIFKIINKKFYKVYGKQWQGDTLLQYDEILSVLRKFHTTWGLLDFSSLSPMFLPMLQRDNIKCAGVQYAASAPKSGKNWKNYIFNNFVSHIDLDSIFYPNIDNLETDNPNFDKDVITAMQQGAHQWQVINRTRNKQAQNDTIEAPYKQKDDISNSDCLCISSVFHPDAKTAFNMYGIQQTKGMPILLSKRAAGFNNMGRR